ncbi:unnamed protein product [Gongylonema pulchrum]|uniref:Overexpressed in colon carcinoma 1 protein n=1 Tax=Gongylonema pulchrum TaxID=637853 RepID=A0A183DX61_9BILA|nr:unnamed protein product [Gongylonema pulchrum]
MFSAFFWKVRKQKQVLPKDRLASDATFGTTAEKAARSSMTQKVHLDGKVAIRSDVDNPEENSSSYKCFRFKYSAVIRSQQITFYSYFA